MGISGGISELFHLAGILPRHQELDCLVRIPVVEDLKLLLVVLHRFDYGNIVGRIRGFSSMKSSINLV